MSAIASSSGITLRAVRAALGAGLVLAALSDAFAADGKPTHPAALDKAIEAYWNADYDAARKGLESLAVARLAPGDRILVHKFLGLCAFAQKQDAETSRNFGEILAIDPTYRLGGDEAAPQVVEVFDLTLDRALKDAYAQGKNLYLARRRAEAAAYFEKAVALSPSDRYAQEFLKLARMDAGEAR